MKHFIFAVDLYSFVKYLLTLSLLCGVARADTVLVIRENGKPYLWDTETGSVIEEIDADRVYIPKQFAPQPPNPPGDPDDPTPPDTSGFAKKVQGWADEIDDSAGAAIFSEAVWKTLKQEMGKGQIATDATTVNSAIKKMMSGAMTAYKLGVLLNGSEDKSKEWEAFNEKVFSELSSRLNESGKLSQDEYVAFFSDVQSGLDATYNDNALPPWVRDIIRQLLPVFLRILQDLLAEAEAAQQTIYAARTEALDEIERLLVELGGVR